MFMIPVLIAAWIYIKHSVEQAILVMDKVMSGEVAPNAIAIAKMMHESPDSGGLLVLAISIYTILLLWVLAAVDVYLLARKSFRREIPYQQVN